MRRYNQTEPPSYNLKAIEFPVALFIGQQDRLADEKDARWLASQISHTLVDTKLLPTFGHLTFAIARDMSYFTGDVLNLIKKYN